MIPGDPVGVLKEKVGAGIGREVPEGLIKIYFSGVH